VFLKYDLDHILYVCFNASMNDRIPLHVDPPSRRTLIKFAAITGAAVVPVKHAWADDEGISRTAESIHQEPVFKASGKRIYEALTDAKQFHKVIQFSEAMRSMSLVNKPTEISDKVGGPFALFGGHIIGRQVELVPSERIVQVWRVVDWDPGVYSIVKFELTKYDSGTKIIFDHTGFPQGKAQHLATGWTAQYWEPLRKYLA
jgi:activator of HSP90 ATPase